MAIRHIKATGRNSDTLCPPSNQKLLEAIKRSAKRLSLCELAIILLPLFNLEGLIVTDEDQPPN